MAGLVLSKLFPRCGPSAVAPLLAARSPSIEAKRSIRKHWNPKFKKLRAAKFMKVELPDFVKERDEEASEDKFNNHLKKLGMQPVRPWVERPFYVSCTTSIIDAYVPPEGDGKVSVVTKEGAKQKMDVVEKKGRSMLAIRKIRQYEEDFKSAEFVKQAQDVYLQAHTYLAEKNYKKLNDFITEKCYPEMVFDTEDKTIRWKFLNSLEPPRVVHSRTADMVSKDNLFAQVTVRFHTQQQLAIYDRFGRLLYGSEILAKDVLEYVVFEKHLSNVYGIWRMHSKIIPEWAPKPDKTLKTYVAQEEEEEPEPPQEEGVSKAIIENDDNLKNTNETKLVTA